MTAVTSFAPPPAPASGPPKRRRWWLTGLVVAWLVAVAGLAVWSVGHDPATVPEQRTVEQAVPELQKATGVLFAAAGGPGRAVVLGRLAVSQDCSVTPLRSGVIVSREVTVYVRAGEARAALDAIASTLSTVYPGRAQVGASRAGTRFALHADAGNFIGIDADAEAGSQSVTLRVSSGCRPLGDGPVDRADPAPGPAPAVLETVLGDLQAGPPNAAPVVPVTSAVACPSGGVAGSYLVDGVAAPPDLAGHLSGFASRSTVVRADEAVRAYRTGNDSVVVVPDGNRLRVSVSTGC